jgi:DNA-binding NarL/FixJ family response regulator
MRMLRIFLIDDDLNFIRATERLLATYPVIEIVGYAQSPLDALEQVTRVCPDVVLVDLMMQGMNGLETTRCIKKSINAPIVIILALFDNPEYHLAAKAAQADGFVAKAELGTKLLPLLQSLTFHDGALT